MSRYIAESITTDAGHFGHIGLCQLCTKHLHAVDKGLRGQNALHQLLLILLRICSRSVCPISVPSSVHVLCSKSWYMKSMEEWAAGELECNSVYSHGLLWVSDNVCQLVLSTPHLVPPPVTSCLWQKVLKEAGEDGLGRTKCHAIENDYGCTSCEILRGLAIDGADVKDCFRVLWVSVYHIKLDMWCI